MTREEFTSTLLGVVERLPRISVDEADVSATGGELYCQTRICTRDRRNLIEDGRRQKRIVLGIQKERGPANLRQEMQ